MTSDSHVAELIPAYALGALEPDEAARVEAHLAVCEACWQEYRAYDALVGDLALAVPLVEPPSNLKGQILTHIAANSAHRPQTPALQKPGWRQRLLELFTIPHPRLAIAGAALILFLLLINGALLWRLNTLQQQAVSQPAPFSIVQLQGSDIAPEASAWMVLLDEGRRGVLIVDALPPLDENQAYQLWLIAPDGRRDSGAVFRVEHSGKLALTVDNPRPLTDYAAFGVTIEPKEGSPEPTGPNVLKGANQPGSA